METQPVETTLYSLSDAPPGADSDRRDGQRHLTLYRVGSILVEGRRELCLIKNISAGGMMIRLYCSIAVGTPVTVELKSGQPVNGKISWTRDQNAGIAFDQPIDVIDILSSSMDAPRPRMPRIETQAYATLRDGTNVLRVRVCDVSQGGVKIACETIIARGSDVVLTLPSLEPQPGLACWVEGGFIGVSFNRLLPLAELVSWLQDQRQAQYASR
ncbi:PilZ domain-containing protein [Sphingomonas sp.]|uniref:PilZ domain-containing protein n=1 Tax=Sphingomonas sp. TaxID=28214 RepID=UPI0025ECA24D|nr:PilZ domain-containing protein [Sphingomonas sp.]